MSTQAHPTLHPAVHEGDHRAGNADAPVTLVEYGDFQCPHCYVAHPLVKELQKRFGSQLQFVFRNFPLNEIHPNALHAAEAAESVAVQSGPDAYWKMHHAIYEHQQDSAHALDDAHLSAYANAIGADGEQVANDILSDTYVARVHDDFMSGVRSGVNGTPTFFLNGERFEGNWTNVEEFARAIGAAIATTDAP